jgi:hypothetical protein
MASPLFKLPRSKTLGKLTDAFNKLDHAKQAFVADMDHWQTEVQNRWTAISNYGKEMSKLMQIDDLILEKIVDQKARSAKALELAGARGKKLAAIDPIRVGNPQAAQDKAFANCDAFAKLIDECKVVLKTYDTKGKQTKDQKKAAAEKLLLEAKLDLAQVKQAKLNYSYMGNSKNDQDDVSAQWSDVKKASEKVQSLKSKIAARFPQLKEDVVTVDKS